MFFDQFNELCKENNTTPTAFVVNILQLSSSKVTAWRNGSIPKYEILKAIADYFGVTVGELFDGKRTSPIQPSVIEFTNGREKEILRLFRLLPDEEQARLIGRVELLVEQAMREENVG